MGSISVTRTIAPIPFNAVQHPLPTYMHQHILTAVRNTQTKDAKQ